MHANTSHSGASQVMSTRNHSLAGKHDVEMTQQASLAGNGRKESGSSEHRSGRRKARRCTVDYGVQAGRIRTRKEEAGCNRRLQEGSIPREVAGTQWDFSVALPVPCDGLSGRSTHAYLQ